MFRIEGEKRSANISCPSLTFFFGCRAADGQGSGPSAVVDFTRGGRYTQVTEL